MALLMGIDLGTTGVKTIVVNENGETVAFSSSSFFYDVPSLGYAEQDPEVWWKETVASVQKISKKINVNEIQAISYSGQMHGLVPLDNAGNVVRNAILHCDQRSMKQQTMINDKFSNNGFSKITYNPAFPGFQLLSLSWLRDNEPKNYERIKYVVCPKDYIRYRMCGEIGVEATDASGTLAFDIIKNTWSEEIFSKLKIHQDMFPKEIHKSTDKAGQLTQKAADLLGLKVGTLIIYGGGDQPIQLIGSGAYNPGQMTITVGSSAQVAAITDHPVFNPLMNTHTFKTVNDDRWFCMGGILSGGAALNWFRSTFTPDKNYQELDTMIRKTKACSNGLVFFPCLAGERTPYLDSLTRGIFLGMSYFHTIGHFARAVEEGVAFAIKNSIELLTQMGCGGSKIIASGGATKSKTWLQIQSDIYGRELYLTQSQEQSALGAAIVAGLGAGIFKDIPEACSQIVRYQDTVIIPDMKKNAIYNEFYNSIYLKLYEKNREIFHALYNLSD